MATRPHKVRYEAKATTNRAHKTTSSARLRLAQRPRMILRPMSAFGPKQTRRIALHMSASGGKADIRKRSCLLSRSLLGAKRTSLFAAHMSAFDPKRTFVTPVKRPYKPPQAKHRGCCDRPSVGVFSRNGDAYRWMVGRDRK